MDSDIIVLGAGAIGTALALHLADRGRRVALVDRSLPGQGTSYGNAGLIERSTLVPYAFPRSLSQLLRYAVNTRSDARYDPAYLPKIAPWLARFWWHSAPRRLERSAEALYPLIAACLDTHEELAQRSGASHLFTKDGWVELLLTNEARSAALLRMARARQSNIAGRLLETDALHAFEPHISGLVPSAVHWSDPWHVRDPAALVKSWADALQSTGGFMLHGDAATLARRADAWCVQTQTGEIAAPEAVVALGPWAGTLTRRLGYRIPMAIKRGYHMHYESLSGVVLRHPLVDEDGGYVISPMSEGIRLTTGIEFAAPERPPNEIQLQKAERMARKVFPLGARQQSEPWLGLRPCLPDMLPIIGRAPRHTGLWLSFGHAHHGLTLAPANGKLLAQMMTGETPFANPNPFRPERFRI